MAKEQEKNEATETVETEKVEVSSDAVAEELAAASAPETADEGEAHITDDAAADAEAPDDSPATEVEASEDEQEETAASGDAPEATAEATAAAEETGAAVATAEASSSDGAATAEPEQEAAAAETTEAAAEAEEAAAEPEGAAPDAPEAQSEAESESEAATTEATDEGPEDDGDGSGRILERAVDAAIEHVEILPASEAGVSVEEGEPMTSVTSADQLEATGVVGYTGEIVGKVVKLADLKAAEEDSEETTANYDQLMRLVDETFTDVTEQEIVKGRVVSIGEKDVVIDIGFKSDGVVPLNEFARELEVNEEVEVFLERLEDRYGQLVLSKTKADSVRRWQRVEEAYENEEVLEGTIVRRIKGGMIVELFDGLEAFLPGSQIDVRPVRDFDAYLEKRMEFKIVKLNPSNENIVVSHKALIEKELEAQRESILSTMEAGQILEGTVKNITDFGVFIDLGGVDGLLHITDLSWGRVSHPSELVELDEKLNVVVLDYDKERQRISLGYKQLQPHPWEKIDEKFTEGDVVEGKVVSITDYGAFVELEKGIEGLVHISEMSWTEHIRHPSQMVSLGQLVNVKILNIDTEGKKISLGMKQLEPDPWEGIADRYPPGTVLRGKVRNITNFGVFVEIEPGIDGLVHISDLSWTKKIRHPSEMIKKGQDLDVVILNIDEKERRISLGHKQVETNPWNQFSQVYSEGTDTTARVVRSNEGGLVVELPLEVEAFVPASELKHGPHNFQEFYDEGQEVELRVIKFDPNQKEIVLSELAKERAVERAERQREEKTRRRERSRKEREVEHYAKKATSGPTTLGELSGLADLKAQIEEAEKAASESEPAEQDEAETASAAADETAAAEEASPEESTAETADETAAAEEASPEESTAEAADETAAAEEASPEESTAEAADETAEAEEASPEESVAEAADETAEAETEAEAEKKPAKKRSKKKASESPDDADEDAEQQDVKEEKDEKSAKKKASKKDADGEEEKTAAKKKTAKKSATKKKDADEAEEETEEA